MAMDDTLLNTQHLCTQESIVCSWRPPSSSTAELGDWSKDPHSSEPQEIDAMEVQDESAEEEALEEELEGLSGETIKVRGALKSK
jgi:hypothetical protein